MLALLVAHLAQSAVKVYLRKAQLFAQARKFSRCATCARFGFHDVSPYRRRGNAGGLMPPATGSEPVSGEDMKGLPCAYPACKRPSCRRRSAMASMRKRGRPPRGHFTSGSAHLIA